VDNIEMDLGEMEWGDMDWIVQIRGMDKWRDLANPAMNFRAL
jgi:hypothetical protein